MTEKLGSYDSSVPPNEISGFWRSDGEYSPSRVSEVSRTGAFISTPHPKPVGTLLELRLDVPRREICAQAVVRHTSPNRGMGVEFGSMTNDDRARLDLLVQQMELGPLAEAARSPAGAFGASGSTSAEDPATGRPRSHRTERRFRARHKVAATVELAQVGSSEPVRANLADLGRGGCYVKMDDPFPLGTAVEISITKNGQSFHSRATVTSAETGKGMGLAFTAIDPKELSVLDEWLTASKERAWLASNRRRSQRMMVNIPVHVAAKDHTGSVISERTKTISVSPNGALLQLGMSVTTGQTLLLRHAVTEDALECSVEYLGVTRNGRREVGVSFVLPNRAFWQIAFPPADWSPQDPYAKRGLVPHAHATSPAKPHAK